MSTGTDLTIRSPHYDGFDETLTNTNSMNEYNIVAAKILFGSVLPQYSVIDIESLHKRLKAKVQHDNSCSFKDSLQRLVNDCEVAIQNSNAFGVHRCFVEFEKLIGIYPELRYMFQKA